MQIRDRIKELRRVKASTLKPSPKNWRAHPESQRNALQGILAEVGYVDAIMARELPDGTLEIVDGHLRSEVTPDMDVPVLVVDLTEAEAALVLATFDPLAAMADSDARKLDELLREVETGNEALQEMLASVATDAGLYLDPDGSGGSENDDKPKSESLADRFLIPPFSVLDARQGYWQDRKRAWLSLGIQSELGRGGGHLAGVPDRQPN